MQSNINDIVNKIMVPYDTWAKQGFSSGFFKIPTDINNGIAPSEKVRKEYLDQEQLNAKSSDTYEEIEERKQYVQEIIYQVQERENAARTLFKKGVNKGVDVFFFSILLFVIAAGLVVYFTGDSETGIPTFNIFNFMLIFPAIYVPFYIFTKFKYKSIRKKLIEYNDVSWIFKK